MTSALKERLMTGADFIPPCTDYTELLELGGLSPSHNQRVGAPRLRQLLVCPVENAVAG